MSDIQKEFEEARKKAEDLERQAKEERLALAKKAEEYAKSVVAEAEEKLKPLGYRLELVKEGEKPKRKRFTPTKEQLAEIERMVKKDKVKAKDLRAKFPDMSEPTAYNYINKYSS